MFLTSIQRSRKLLGVDTGERTGLLNDLFGIHGNKYGYTITHLVTGLICGEAKKQAEARRKCEALTLLPIDWASENPMESVSEETRLAVRQIAITPLSTDSERDGL